MAAAAPPVAPQVVGRYALYGKIAAGGMATVHFGRMLGAAGFTRTVAIKRLHPHLAEEPELATMMIDEARLVARVQHPNVAQTLDVVAEGGELLIVMEYVSGDSLAHLLRVESARQRHVPLPIASAVTIGMLHGLHAAHSAKSDLGEPLGIVHRDVSPHNVLVGIDGLVRVIDFGVAKAAGRIQTTRAGVVKGKLPYMAPEQLGGQDTSRLADIYAAGVVLWELLTGRRLFRADDDVTLFSLVLAGPSDPPSKWAAVPASLDAIVMRALARDPSARFGTAREMADALARAAPPALATDVGAWVEDAAKQLLDERNAQLSWIESQSNVPAQIPAAGVASAAWSAAPSPGPGPALDDDLPTVISQPSSMIAAMPDAGPRRDRRSRAATWLIAACAVCLAGGVALAIALRLGTHSTASHPVASVSSPASVVSAPTTPSAPSSVAVPPEAPAALAADSVTAPATTTSSQAPLASKGQTAGPAGANPSPAWPPTGPHPISPSRPNRPTPNPAGSVIFATPD